MSPAPSIKYVQKLFESLNVIFCVLDMEGRFVYINKASYRLWGYQPEELIGIACYSLMVEEDIQPSQSKVDQMPFDQPFRGSVENRYFHKDGRIITMLWEGGGYDPDTGLIYTTGRDVSEQRRLEKLERAHLAELQATKEELQQLVDRITDGFLGLDKDDKVIYWNKAAETIALLPQETMVGHLIWDVMPEPTLSLVREQLAIIREQNRPLHLEYFAERIQRWIEVHAYISGTGVSIFFRDVTERIQLQNQLVKEKEQQQKRITHAVINATEEERAHVGKELHDNVNQVLTTVKLYIELCQTDNDRREELLKRSAQLLQESISEIRGLSKRLSSPSLGRISLSDSLAELVEAVNASNRIKVFYCYKAGQLKIPEHVHIAVYRILQEHFTNILKHAKASEVKLQVWKEGGMLKLTVDDNGKGFDPFKVRKGMGLANMNSRAESINALLELKSAPGKGCNLSLHLPLKSRH